tara:strand:- start:35 stop:898 length:864 start_codon:yes stop_codon:yes gene_type:complete
MTKKTLDQKKFIVTNWFEQLRNNLCSSFVALEQVYADKKNLHDLEPPSAFEQTKWERKGGGGGVMSIMKGRVFEKVGVNISTVHGEFTDEFKKDIPGAAKDPRFWASGISVVAHMTSPLVPAVHMNNRFIVTTKDWFGGGSDLTPIYPNKSDSQAFHNALKAVCDNHDPNYYPKFKKWCDQYFSLPHRKETRGVGGIFFDYLNTGNWNADFSFTQDIGKAFLKTYPKIVEKRMFEPWTPDQREYQLVRRGRYVEFNLLYDRGTVFGLKTGGNAEAILMSLPPAAKWP